MSDPIHLPKSVTAPYYIEAPYLSACRSYPVLDWKGVPAPGIPAEFVIADDTGDRIYCRTHGCSHLGGRNWVVDEE